MATKPKIQPDNPEQSKRFIEMAREIGAAETREEADKALGKVLPRTAMSKPKKARPS